MPDREKGTPEQPKENFQLSFSEEGWANTPVSVREFMLYLVSSNAAPEKCIEELEKG